uniref:Uncharacterized protein n=1 Tax=Anguilla anguilla TaxID=7936 RepID=A0A0E9XP34_ANGAN
MSTPAGYHEMRHHTFVGGRSLCCQLGNTSFFLG